MISSSEGCRIMSEGKRDMSRDRSHGRQQVGQQSLCPPKIQVSTGSPWEGQAAHERHGLLPLYFLALGIRVSLVSSSSSSEIFRTRVL